MAPRKWPWLSPGYTGSIKRTSISRYASSLHSLYLFCFCLKKRRKRMEFLKDKSTTYLFLSTSMYKQSIISLHNGYKIYKVIRSIWIVKDSCTNTLLSKMVINHLCLSHQLYSESKQSFSSSIKWYICKVNS